MAGLVCKPVYLCIYHIQVWRAVRLGPDGEPISAEGFILKRMLLEKGRHVLQAGIRCGYLSKKLFTGCDWHGLLLFRPLVRVSTNTTAVQLKRANGHGTARRSLASSERRTLSTDSVYEPATSAST